MGHKDTMERRKQYNIVKGTYNDWNGSRSAEDLFDESVPIV